MQRYLKDKLKIADLRISLLVILLFLAISILFFREILLSKGVVVGQDWMFPVNSSQMERYIERPFYTWSYDMNLFGIKNPFSVQMPFVVLVKLFLLLGLDGATLSKAFIIIVFTLSGTSMFFLLRYIGLKKITALVGGFIFITMPIFFNYTIMGWCFVLFSMGVILPITVILFIESVKKGDTGYAVLSGLLYAIAILQSQSLIWYPMVFLALAFYLIKDKISLSHYLKSFGIVILLALALHSTWWPNLFINQDPGVMNSNLALDAVSEGMRARLSFVNILRGWGSLFNQNYEVGYPEKLISLSFLIPLMAFFSLTIKKIKTVDIRIPLVIIFLFVFVLFIVKPNTVAKIPLSNIVRDTARFTILSTFSLTILASICLDHFLRKSYKLHRLFAYLLIFLIVINSLPFLSGELTAEPKNVYDVRLRNYAFPNGYTLTEKYLYTSKNDIKSYYPPSGTNIGIKNKPKFSGDFREIKDPFRGYSPLPGTIYMYYSSMGKPTEVSSLLESLFTKKIDKTSLMMMGLMNIGKIIIRNDITYTKTQTGVLKKLIEENPDSTSNFGNVQVLENNYTVPHFYVPDKTIYSSGGIEMLPKILSVIKDTNHIAVYFANAENISQKKLLSLNILKTANSIFIEAQKTVTKNSYGKSEYSVNIPQQGEYTVFTNKNITLENRTIDNAVLLTNRSSNAVPDTLLEIGKLYLPYGKQILNTSDKTTNTINEPHNTETKIFLQKASRTSAKTTPKIEFVRVNPTKYRLKVKNATEPYTLVFSDSFHYGWNIYEANTGAFKPKNIKNEMMYRFGKLGTYIANLFTSDKGFGKVTASYYSGKIKEGTHNMIFLEPSTFETWGKDPIAQDTHLIVNGYANSWRITPASVGGKNNYELIVEFVPQRFFYIGFGILIITLTFCIIYILTKILQSFHLHNEK